MESVGSLAALCVSAVNNMPRTIIEKIWDAHVVSEQAGAPAFCSISICIWCMRSPRRRLSRACASRGLKVRRPDLTIATTDHSMPTTHRSLPIVDQIAATQVALFEKNCREFGIPCYGLHSAKQGIVHVIGPEQGSRSRA